MLVMIGWSGEVASGQWRKMDCTLDDTDFILLLAEHDAVGSQYSLTQKFVILELECQRFVAATRLKRHSDLMRDEQIDQLKIAVKDYTRLRDELILKLKSPV